jgi:hypothetical protein
MATGLTFEGYLYTWHSEVAAVPSPYTSTMQQLQPRNLSHGHCRPPAPGVSEGSEAMSYFRYELM